MRIRTEDPSPTIRRLLLVKQILQNAVGQSSDRTDLGRMFTIQKLDFSVETTLKTVVSIMGPATDYPGPQHWYGYRLARLNAEKYSPKMDFVRLFDEVVALYRDPSKGIERDSPPLRTEMQSLHDLRNDVEHNGSIPSAEDVSRNVSFAESFIASVVSETFDKNLEEIFLSDAVSRQELRSFLREAEDRLNEGKLQESCSASAKAFRTLTNLQDRHNARGRYVRFLSSSEARRVVGQFQDLFNLFDAIIDPVSLLEEQMIVLTVGADVTRYNRFREVTPKVSETMGGLQVRERENWNPTREDALEQWTSCTRQF